MLVEQLGILGNISIVKIGNAKIKKDVEKKGEIEYNKIKPKVLSSNYILHSSIDAEDPEWLDQQIQ
jgi:hypothetical protein